MYQRVILTLFSVTINFVHSEFFTAVSEFEKFLNVEVDSVKKLENYLDVETKRLENMKNDIESYKKVINDGLSHGVDNPVQFYLTMKNIISRWNAVVSHNVADNMKAETFQNITKMRTNRRVIVPSENDLQMSRLALARLQNMYNLNHKDLASGEIIGVPKSKSTMDANDCFQMGQVFTNLRNYNNSVSWIKESLIRLKHETRTPTVEKVDVLKHYAYLLHKVGEKSEAKQILSQLIQLYDKDDNFFDYFIKYGKNVSQKVEEETKEIGTPNYDNYQDYNLIPKVNYTPSIYKSLCNDEYRWVLLKNPNLKCYYKTDRPFLRLAPIKVELLNVKPAVYLYKGIISDNEIDILVNIAQTKLQIGKIVGKNGSGLATDLRVSKVAWLYEMEHSILPLLNKRIEDAIGLDLTYSEPLQMSHYGIGGHFDVHWDAQRPEISHRIATLLFYLSTPMAGGATVFPLAKVTSFPHKNDAIFWFNLLKNGKLDELTMHAGCPVLSGKKWVANKWINYWSQTFVRKCSLNENE